MKRLRAISIRQPFVEQIMRGTKKFEFRSRPTSVRGRVYVYASKGRRPAADWRGMDVAPGNVLTGLIVGTVEIVGCRRRGPRDCAWVLKAPKRIRRPIKPVGQPQPVWFYPFGR